MPKLLWVALPLLLLAAWLAVAWATRRTPSRLAVNVVSSVLLLAYVATTAGLGVFWVAQQQLPVFDWHYLFGYATVALVVLHLAFNFGSVWRFFAGRLRRGERGSERAAAPAVALAPRRRLLGTVGAIFAAAAAFALGLRHGRSELRLQWPQGVPAVPPAAGGALPASSMGAVEQMHAFSSHSRTGALLRAPSVEWGDAPPPFKSYAGRPRVALPAPRRSDRDSDLAAVSLVLWSAAGITAWRQGLALRAAPSSGALYASEFYVLARSLPGLARGVWHYDPHEHALQRVGDDDERATARLAAADAALAGAPAVIVASAIFRRSGHKYRDRTYRYVTADLGHALENMRVVARSSGAEVRFAPRFDEAAAAALLQVDEHEEGVLAVAAWLPRALGTSWTAPPPARTPVLAAVPASAAGPVPAAVPGTAPGLRWQPPPAPDERALPLGVTGAMHLATSLRIAAAPPLPTGPLPGAAALPAGSVRLPRVARVEADAVDVIARRRSLRRYAAAPLALGDLAALLEAMLGREAAVLSGAVRVNVVVHAVEAVVPGAWRYDAAAHALLPRRTGRPLRAAARAAALDQDVIGDAAAVFVLSVDRAAIAADPAGAPRGWRHAFIEAGLVGERVYLEAVARGLGACAVGAFYDDEAAALVGIDPQHEWIVHFAAVGVPG